MDNPQNSASPPLYAIEQMLPFYEAKLQTEEAKTNELERQLKESQDNRNRLRIMVDVLKADQEQALAERQDSFSGKTTASAPDSQANSKTSSDQKTPDVRSEPSWFELIKQAMRAKDNLLTNQDVFEYLESLGTGRTLHYQTVSGNMSAYRGTGHLIGFPVYSKSPNGKPVKQFVTGLPSFFEDTETKRLKPEYEAKIKDKMSEQGLYFYEPEVSSSQKANPHPKQ